MIRKRAWLVWASLMSSGSLTMGACGGDDSTAAGPDAGGSDTAVDQTSGDGNNDGGQVDGAFPDGHGEGGSGADGAPPDVGAPLCNDPCIVCLQQTCTSQVADCVADTSCRAAWQTFQACRCADAG